MMHDHLTLKKFSDQQLQDMLQSIERKFMGALSQQSLDALGNFKESIAREVEERQWVTTNRVYVPETWNLTSDGLSDYEEKNKQSKDT